VGRLAILAASLALSSSTSDSSASGMPSKCGSTVIDMSMCM